ncbi:hypothetical protein AMECASPLE_031404 [Ameca splendens]|uniref:Uncharacterized protein n=1 Tax=Ameca splendens TaxID=208324 RepID=A0ABV0Y6B3_9TELE
MNLAIKLILILILILILFFLVYHRKPLINYNWFKTQQVVSLHGLLQSITSHLSYNSFISFLFHIVSTTKYSFLPLKLFTTSLLYIFQTFFTLLYLSVPSDPPPGSISLFPRPSCYYGELSIQPVCSPALELTST